MGEQLAHAVVGRLCAPTVSRAPSALGSVRSPRRTHPRRWASKRLEESLQGTEQDIGVAVLSRG